MANDKIETKIIQGKAHWCKLLGKPRPSYDGKKNEWTVDIELDRDGLKALKEFGIDIFYVKKGKPNKDGSPNATTGKPMLKLTRNALRSDGSAANPVVLRDEHGEPWDSSKLIGNGTTVNLKLMKFEVKLPNQPARLKPYLLEMQIWDLVPYEGSAAGGGGGFPTKEGKKATNEADWDFNAAAPKANHQQDPDDFSDEIPF